MTATIRFNDGKEVELSEETTKKLRAELVKPEHPIVTVCNFLDVKDNRLILNLPDDILADRYKGDIIVINKQGHKCNRCDKNGSFVSTYTNKRKVF